MTAKIYQLIQSNFWQKLPALWTALSVLIGVYLQQYNTSLLIIIALLFCLSVCIIRRSHKFKLIRLSLVVLFLGTGFFWSKVHIQNQLNERTNKGLMHLKLKSIERRKTAFGTKLIYLAYIKNFYLAGQSSSSLRGKYCTICQKKIKYLADKDYYVLGTLSEDKHGRYQFMPAKDKSWLPVNYSFSLAQIRYELKSNFKLFLEKNIASNTAANFLGALITGDLESFQLKLIFASFGLQHLLAVSGFHFFVIAFTASLLLNLIFSAKPADILLLLLVTCFALFVGLGPSVIRSWTMCAIYIIGKLLGKESVALNSMGLAIIFIVIYEPSLCTTVGFQLTFLATGSILLLFGPINTFFSGIFTNKIYTNALLMSWKSKLGYIFINFLKVSLSLTIAVNLFTAPLAVYYFKQFSLLSLFLNIFTPFLVSLALAALVLSLLFFKFSLFFSFLMQLTSSYTAFILYFLYGIPGWLDYKFVYQSLSLKLLVVYYLILIWGSISAYEKHQELRVSKNVW